MLIDYIIILPLVTAIALLIIPRGAAGALKGSRCSVQSPRSY